MSAVNGSGLYKQKEEAFFVKEVCDNLAYKVLYMILDHDVCLDIYL